MTKSYFVTGTDTGVGKTIASAALLQAARLQGWVTAGYKPVATGSKMTSVGLRNDDALILQRNSSLALPYLLVNCYTFAELTSPHIVSADEGRTIEFDKMTQGLHELETLAEWVIVEGAGGWFTPLNRTQTFADWVIQEKLPVILVVGIKLGCINHAILTMKAIAYAGLHLAGWIANDISLISRRHNEYLLTLKQVLHAPFLGEIPWLEVVETEKAKIGQYLDLSVVYST